MNTAGIEIRRAFVAALTVLVVGFGLATPAPAGAASGSPVWSDGQGLQVVSATKVEARVWKLVVSTPLLSRPVRVDVLLPRGYADTQRRYPSLYLFHGTSGGAEDWLTMGDAKATTAAYPMIVVMPDAGYDSNGGSWFTDWVDQQTSLGAANWESYHIGQLVPFIDAHLRTVRSRNARAIAGLSQGGFGSTSYAARHPDLFGAAASFSGAPDIFRAPQAAAAAYGVISGTMTGLNQVEPNAPFGDQTTHALTWAGHNPASLVTNLRHTDLALWTGNGQPGPLDGDPSQVVSSPIEAIVHESSTLFVGFARDAGLKPYFDDYGPGTHSWPYWTRDMKQYLPRLQRYFDRHVARPTRVGYVSTETRWAQWGWRVKNLGDAGWTGLARADRHGFKVTGSHVRVRTPRFYDPGHTYRLTWTGSTGPATARANRQGRLMLDVTAPSGAASVVVRG